MLVLKGIIIPYDGSLIHKLIYLFPKQLSEEFFIDHCTIKVGVMWWANHRERLGNKLT